MGLRFNFACETMVAPYQLTEYALNDPHRIYFNGRVAAEWYKTIKIVSLMGWVYVDPSLPAAR